MLGQSMLVECGLTVGADAQSLGLVQPPSEVALGLDSLAPSELVLGCWLGLVLELGIWCGSAAMTSLG